VNECSILVASDIIYDVDLFASLSQTIDDFLNLNPLNFALLHWLTEIQILGIHSCFMQSKSPLKSKKNVCQRKNADFFLFSLMLIL
jgi:hypothetical protein